jgi:two-component system, NarL family, response regulator YdfI
VTKKFDHQLTKRELQILQKLTEAQSNKQIASALSISIRTVSAHLSTIYLKLNLEQNGQNQRIAAMNIAIERGINANNH